MESKETKWTEEFQFNRYDGKFGDDNFTFTEEQLHQQLLQNAALVGKTFQLNPDHPVPMRISRCIPYEDFYYFQIRSCSHKHWGKKKQPKKRKPANPKATVDRYLAFSAEQNREEFKSKSNVAYQLRTTAMIGPQDPNNKREKYSYLVDTSGFTEHHLEGLGLESVRWKQGKNGALGGIVFRFNDGSSSIKLGEGRTSELEEIVRIQDEQRITKVLVLYNQMFISAIEFYNREGEQEGDTINGEGVKEGEFTQMSMGFLPGERIVGAEVQEVEAQGGELMIQNIAFKLLGTAREDKDVVYFSYADGLNWEESKALAESQGGRLLTIQESQDYLRNSGALFSGEDQWAAVVGKDGGKDWVQVGDEHHTIGRSHSDFGYPNWGHLQQVLRWRNVAVFKKEAYSPKDFHLDAEWKPQLYLSVLKIFKPAQGEAPELVKEILCESNKFPCLDWGPSNIYFDKSLYYFKRLHGQKTVLQLFKFNLQERKEYKINGYCLTEYNNVETQIQFVDMADCQQQLASEQEFLNNLFISRKHYMLIPWIESYTNRFYFYKMSDLSAPIYDSGEISLQYFSKLVCWRENENYVRFYFHTLKKKYYIKLAINNRQISIQEKDIEDNVLSELTNPHENYYEDWPSEVHFMDLNIDGKTVTVHYFNVLSEKGKNSVEIFEPHFNPMKHNQVACMIQKVYMDRLRKEHQQNQQYSMLHRLNSDLSVPFPAVAPTPIIMGIFDHYMNLNWDHKFYESFDQRTLVLYELGGTRIAAASLRKESQYRTLQEAMANEYAKKKDDSIYLTCQVEE